jgi:hypothetical protein
MFDIRSMNRINALTLREKWILAFVGVAILSRLIVHIPNVTAVTATALFAGRFFQRKSLAFAVPIVVMAVTDLFFGFYTISLFVYAALLGTVAIGQFAKRISVWSVLASSVLFFVLTNFGVWILGYPKTWEGFVACYTAAIPFFRASLIGDFGYAALLALSFRGVERTVLAKA